MSYKGFYRPQNPKKYTGDSSQIVYRSLWERQVFKWCDTSSDVISWSSEETIIPYKSKIDGTTHRYFPDLKIMLNNGNVLIVEIKPHKETLPPKKPERRTRKYLNEVISYGKNQSKWEAAEEFCKKRGWIFEVWTEHTLQEIGMRIINPNRRKRKREHHARAH